MVKAETLPSYPDQREIQLGEPLSFELVDFKEQRRKKKKKKKLAEEENEILDIRVRFPRQ